MIRNYYQRPALAVAAPLFDPASVVDPLTGAVPTWRLDEEPIYLEVIRDLGVPGLADPAGPVLAGDVVEVDEPVAPGMVRLCYCAPHPCSCDFEDGNEYPIRVDDAPPTRALRLAPAPAPDACPDCGAVDPNPCRPKSDPVHGRALTRQHRRRRALAEAGRGELALVLVVLAVVLAVATGVGSVLSGAVDGVTGPWPSPCNRTTVCEPAP